MCKPKERSWVLFSALLFLLAASCAYGSEAASPTMERIRPTTVQVTGVPKPTPPPIPPTATPQPVGMSRSNPVPCSETVSVPNWDVQVVEVVRGDEAWLAIDAANMFNQPPPEGMEYLLVRLHVRCTYADGDEHSIGGSDFRVTGDRLIEYFNATVVEPDPRLDAYLFADGETEGWSAYLVGQGEGSLILIVDELPASAEDQRRYIALDEGASIAVAPELGEIRPTDLGEERGSPAPLGQTVTTEDWEVTVLEVVRGADAWSMVQEANRFNDPPLEGMEYIAVRIRARYISTVDEAAPVDDLFYFKSTGDAGVLYDLPGVIEPSPALDARLFPGGQYEGWVILQAGQGESGMMAVFAPLFDFSSRNRRFLSLEP